MFANNKSLKMLQALLKMTEKYEYKNCFRIYSCVDGISLQCSNPSLTPARHCKIRDDMRRRNLFTGLTCVEVYSTCKRRKYVSYCDAET